MFSLMLPDAPAAAAVAAVDPVSHVILMLAVVLIAAKLGGEIAERLGQPAVLGELVAGILLGNLDLVGLRWVQTIPGDPTIDVLGKLGAVLLLFEVGLESTVTDIMKVGGRAFVVAVLGVVTPWLLGWGVGALVLPDASPYVHAFLGATLTATSVGITARVLLDLGRSQSSEARVILGAAVIDDVLGLLILAVITSVIATANAGTGVSYVGLAAIFGKATAFLVGALAIGRAVSPGLFGVAGRMRGQGQGVLLVTALVLCFLLAYTASMVGLAPIVGAYAAGLILEEAHYVDLVARSGRSLQELVRPIATFLVPIFFVIMGTRVRLETFAHPDILGLAGLLTLAAIVGKQACSLGGIGGRLNKLAIGIGMIPRGEVGLIFANLGLALTLHGAPVVDQGIYSAVVIMVVMTALITPPALKWVFGPAPEPEAAPTEPAWVGPVPLLAGAVAAVAGAPHRFRWDTYRETQPWLKASRPAKPESRPPTAASRSSNRDRS
ncbi:MAG TPA: cation:proton antiporter [Gemmatimonadales bacterium]|nr:cation:proton antiporter [Gemmatimonadales bacterium]